MDEQVKQIVAGGIIAILRVEQAGDFLPTGEAIREGGVTAIEVTFPRCGTI